MIDINNTKDLREYLASVYPESIILDGLDKAIIGVSTNCNIIYSVDGIINILMELDGMTFDDALEYFGFNIERALPYMTDGVPPILINELPVNYPMD